MITVPQPILDRLPRWAVDRRWSGTLQRLMDRSPGFNRLAVNVGAAIGYCLVFGLPLVSLLLTGLVVSTLAEPDTHWYQPGMLALLAITATAGWATLELALLRPAAPGGQTLTKVDAHRLFGLIERRITNFGSAEIHEVRLTRDCEVRVVRTPTTGFLVNQRNTLCIGLPLLHMLNYDQFRVELRAAIGHFAATKDRNRGELVTLRDSWDSYAACLADRRSPGAWLLRGFIAVYHPFFRQLSQQAARDHALLRDQYISEVLPDMETLKLIANKTVGEHFLQARFWPKILKTADRHPTPSARPFSNFAPMLRQMLIKADAERWLLKAMTQPDDPRSVSPTLAERVGALGYNQIHFIALPTEPAIERLLGRQHSRLAKAVDLEWRSDVLPEWQARHRHYQEEKARFENLHAKFEQQKLEGPAAVKYAILARTYLSAQDAVPVLQTLLHQNPHNAEVAFQIGQRLLELDDPEGLRALEHCMSIDKAYVHKAAPLLSNYSVNHKRRQNQDAKRKVTTYAPGTAHVA